MLHGTIGTGKTSAALHYVKVNKKNFVISWRVEASAVDDDIISELTRISGKLGVSYEELFQTIEQRARNEEIIFVLDNMEKKPDTQWFKELFDIRCMIQIIITTTNNSPWCWDFPDTEELELGKFDDALGFLVIFSLGIFWV